MAVYDVVHYLRPSVMAHCNQHTATCTQGLGLLHIACDLVRPSLLDFRLHAPLGETVIIIIENPSLDPPVRKALSESRPLKRKSDPLQNDNDANVYERHLPVPRTQEQRCPANVLVMHWQRFYALVAMLLVLVWLYYW